jgi:CHASE3 domain sensor protein
MKSLLYIVKARRNALLLFVFTILSLVFLIKLISDNSEKRKTGESALQLSNKVIQNIESIRSSITEAESLLQSYLLTGDQQWKRSLFAIHGRVYRVLEETAVMETDPLQQKKFALIKQALQNKISFQQTIMRADSITPELRTEMGYYGLNRRLTARIQSPMRLLLERQELLLQRKTEANADAANQARFLTIFYAVFIYLFILYALWQLRKQAEPGPAAEMLEEKNETNPPYSHENNITPVAQEDFRGVFSIHEGYIKGANDNERTGIVRVLWPSQQELDKNFGNMSASTDVLHLHQENDHYLGHAVNAHYFQPGPSFNRVPNGYIPGGIASYNLYPIPSLPLTRLPSQEQPGFQLVELVQSVLGSFYSRAEEKNIRLLHTIDPAIPHTLSGDAEKLGKILNGLLDNAMRFTYKGYVQLTISCLKMDGEQTEIAFSVADTGKGIDPDKMQDLLHGNGTQLPALAQARRLVESQYNQLMVHSTEEDGTVCCFTACFRC